MSRVSYVMMNPGSEKELTRAIRGCLAKLTAELANDAEIERDDILEVVLVGNPVMHHLLLGIDPTELGGAPFALAVDESVRDAGPRARASDQRGWARVHPPVHRRARRRRHRRGDPLRGPVRHRRGEPHRRCRHERRDRAGESRPAPRRLEPDGARVRGGPDLVRSARGARRDRARADRSRDARAAAAGDRLRPLVGRARVRRHAGHGRLRVGDHRGARRAASRRRDRNRRHDRRRPAPPARHGSSRTVAPSRTSSMPPSRSSCSRRTTFARSSSPRPRSTRAACCCSSATASTSVDRIRLAGAFGSHIDPVHALVLGLVPDCDPARVTSAGNAAGTGARIALLDRSARAEIEAVVRRVEKIETAIEPRFQEYFVNAMAIPHDTDPYSRLAATVALPARKTAETARACRPPKGPHDRNRREERS